MAVSCINRSNPYVLVGVMAAGLLTFVATSLEGLVEVTGAQAFELVETGIEVAKTHLAAHPGPSD